MGMKVGGVVEMEKVMVGVKKWVGEGGWKMVGGKEEGMGEGGEMMGKVG